MIVLIRPEADAASVAALAKRIWDLGLQTVALEDARGRAFEVLGAYRGRVLSLRGDPAVQEILTRRAALEGGEPLWPHVALRTGILALLLLVALVLLTAFLPPALGDRAGEGSPAASGTEWYLRPLDAFLGVFRGPLAWIGGILVLVLWAGLFALPFVDTADPRTPRGRLVVRCLRGLGVAAVALFVVLALGVGR